MWEDPKIHFASLAAIYANCYVLQVCSEAPVPIVIQKITE